MSIVHRAVDDLSVGMRSLFGVGGERPELVEELLGEPRKRPARPRWHLRVVRRRAPRKSHLVRVK